MIKQNQKLLKNSVKIYEATIMNSVRHEYKDYKCVYLWFNKLNNKIYIGSAKNLFKRLEGYFWSFKNENNYENPLLMSEIKEYGLCNFYFCILEKIDKNIDQFKVEQRYLDIYKSWDRNIGYNLSRLAKNPKINFTPEIREKMSLSLRGKGGKLKKDDVLNIFNLLSQGVTTHEIAKIYNISPITVRSIRSRKSWKYLDIPEEFVKKIKYGAKNLGDSTALEIGYDLQYGLYSAADLAKKYKVVESTIGRINLGQSYSFVKAKLEPNKKWIWNFVNIHKDKKEGIIKLLKLGNITRHKISKIVGVSPQVVREIAKEVNIIPYKYGT